MCGPIVLWFIALLVLMTVGGDEAGNIFIFGTVIFGALWLWRRFSSGDSGHHREDGSGGGGNGIGFGGGGNGDGDGDGGGGDGGGGSGGGGA